MKSCMLCPRKCGAARDAEHGFGFCGCGAPPSVARAAAHMWEEPVISGSRGSGAIFFSGCTMQCVFCQNDKISSGRFGRQITSRGLAQIYERLEKSGVHNINLVSGTQFVPAIIEAFGIYRPRIPVVWNSSGYEAVETIRLLKDYVDIWLPDFKYADGQTAGRYSGAPDYPQAAESAIGEMLACAGENIIKDGIMQRGVIIRHLILPANTHNSIAVLRRIKEAFPQGTLVSLMAQYIPCGKADTYPEINRRITAREYKKVCGELFALELDGFVQERESASSAYIPSFDLNGVEF